MSPDNYQKNPAVALLIARQQALSVLCPYLASSITRDEGWLSRLTVFVGDTSEFVAGVGYFDDDGSPMICWGSGLSLIDALVNVDTRLSQGRGKVDKRTGNGG